MNTLDNVTFTAWLRVPPGRWRRIASGSVEAVVRRQLDLEARRHQHCDTLVTADAAEDPNRR